MSLMYPKHACYFKDAMCTSVFVYIYIYICYPPPLQSMDFRLLGRGRLKGFSNSLISHAVSMKIHCTGC